MVDRQAPRKRIAFVGAGAMGSYIGGRIAQSGGDVVLIDPWRKHVDAIRRKGLRLGGTEGESEVWVDALYPEEVGKRDAWNVEIAFVAVKSYDTEWAANLARPLLAPEGFVVSLQNGLNEVVIARIIGADRTVGCIASTIGVALRGPGVVERTYRPGGDAYTVFRVGELDGGITPRIEQLAALLRCVDSAEVTTDLRGERWAKLVANSMHNGLAAVTGLGHIGIYGQERTRRFAIRLGGEAVRVGRKLGLRLPPVRSIPADDLEAAGYGDTAALERVEKIMASWTQRLTDGGRPSTAQDVAKGRRTEIDYINGAVCDGADEVNVPVPFQRAITALVKRVERGEVAPSLSNLPEM